jgi:hypothetical protein
MSKLLGMEPIAWRPRDPKGCYMTEARIKATMKPHPFVSWPDDFDFNNAQHRFIDDECRAVINEKKRAMRDVEFERFLSQLTMAEIPESIIETVSGLFYGKPLFLTALMSGATIHLGRVYDAMVASKENFKGLCAIVTSLCAQVTYASFLGVIRDYYTALMVAQGGKPAKASRMFLGVFDELLEKGSFEINFGKEGVPQIINALRDDLGNLKSYGRAGTLTYEITEAYARNSFYNMHEHIKRY